MGGSGCAASYSVSQVCGGWEEGVSAVVLSVPVAMAPYASTGRCLAALGSTCSHLLLSLPGRLATVDTG